MGKVSRYDVGGGEDDKKKKTKGITPKPKQSPIEKPTRSASQRLRDSKRALLRQAKLGVSNEAAQEALNKKVAYFEKKQIDNAAKLAEKEEQRALAMRNRKQMFLDKQKLKKALKRCRDEETRESIEVKLEYISQFDASTSPYLSLFDSKLSEEDKAFQADLLSRAQEALVLKRQKKDDEVKDDFFDSEDDDDASSIE